MSKSEKVVVLVSGGQDSTVAYHLAVQKFGKENVTALYVDIGQPYKDQELKALAELEIPVNFVYADLCTNFLNNIPTPDKQAIYGRNTLMTFYGALLGERVWLSALENELIASVPDMEWNFFTQATAFYTTVFKELRPHTIVETPFETMTKTEMIAMAIRPLYIEHETHLEVNTLNGPCLGLTKEYMLKTVSCYDPQGSCGKCAACFKRWISWVNNDIEEHFTSKPYTSTAAEKVINGMRNGEAHYWASKKRVAETHNALIQVGHLGVISGWYSHQYPPPLIPHLDFDSRFTNTKKNSSLRGT